MILKSEITTKQHVAFIIAELTMIPLIMVTHVVNAPYFLIYNFTRFIFSKKLSRIIRAQIIAVGITIYFLVFVTLFND
jgi:hypothetical protein